METRTYRPNFLCENTGNQKIGSKTPEKHNAKKKHSKHSGKFVNIRRISPTPNTPSKGEKKNGSCSLFLSFQGMAWGFVSCLAWLRAPMGMPVWTPDWNLWERWQAPTFSSCIRIFWIFTVLINLHWYLILVFKWNSLMTCNVQFFSSCFLAICISSLVRCLFTSFPHCYVINFTF